MKFTNPVSVRFISELIESKILGNPDLPVSGLNEIHMVSEGDLTFVDHPKYYTRTLNSNASVIIINQEVTPPDGKVILFSEDPFRDYVKLVTYFRPFEHSAQQISNSAQIGEGTIIQPGVFIGNHVKIGSNCIIHANVSIYDHTEIGNNVIIHSNSVIGADAYYFQKRPAGFRKLESCGRVIIHDRVEIGALCSIDKGVSGDTIIDEGTKFDNHVQVGHDTYIGKHCLIGSHAAIAGVTRIEDHVILWGRVAVNKDLVVGEGAVILATSAISKSLEGHKTYFGAPAEEAKKKWKELAMIRRLPEIFEKLK